MSYFVVEGNIGAGKSTFMKVVGARLNAEIVYEPHTAWQNIDGENLLEAFYRDGNRWAYTFQTYAFLTRIFALEKQMKVLEKSYVLSERSVYADRYCFAKNAYEIGLMNDLEWKLYCDWFSWFVENRTQQPNGFIYLRANPDVCYARLNKRNRSEEKTISLEYLHLLHEKHEQWLVHRKGIAGNLTEIPVLILDCDQDFESDEQVQGALAESVAQFVSLQIGVPHSQVVGADKIV